MLLAAMDLATSSEGSFAYQRGEKWLPPAGLRQLTDFRPQAEAKASISAFLWESQVLVRHSDNTTAFLNASISKDNPHKSSIKSKAFQFMTIQK